MAELDKLEEAMEDRFALLQVQVESLSLSTCPCTTGKCPCKCNGGAPMREPPRPRADAEDEFVKRDPWKKYPRRGDGGGRYASSSNQWYARNWWEGRSGAY